ncbi:PepSY domain-containing protein [uncultured Limosilactobacillus sp.]|uniref:PepSY domain-containing protein n=1 Tax=uncultured Limosilactobacillus sp. TaxID=2837629 RepID=UPI0025EBC3C4|nr:PepSY domain-containing protein [uncultured Limosilactobacillus sp.]
MKTTTFKKRLVNALAVTVITTSSLGGVFLASPLVMTTASANADTIKITEKDAVKKFKKEFKDSRVTEIQLEKKGGSYRYEISGMDNSKEHNMDVNAKSGKVIHKSSEKLDDDDQESALDLDKLITRKQATKVAEKAANSGKAHNWSLSYDDGTPVWEIEVGHGHKQHDVKVNANNKKVISNTQDD